MKTKQRVGDREQPGFMQITTDMTARLRSFAVLLFMAWLCVPPYAADAQRATPHGEPMVVKVIRLDHADAEQLASVLGPLLTNDGQITAYPPTNTLIIRDRKSRVEQLVNAIKGETTPRGKQSPPPRVETSGRASA